MHCVSLWRRSIRRRKTILAGRYNMITQTAAPYISHNAPYKETDDEKCVTWTDMCVRHMAYILRRMFFVRCVSDMYGAAVGRN